MNYLYALLLSIFPFFLFSQNGTPAIAGARGAAMGGVGVAFTDVNSAFRNQAGLAYVETLSALVSGERRFIASPINSLSAAAAYPVDFGTFGLTMNYFGVDAFKEQKIGLAYARRLFDQLAVGVQFDFLNTQIQEYGSKGVLTVEAGLHSQISEAVAVAVHVYSPARVEILEGETLPSVFNLGFAYTPSKTIFLTAEVEKDLDFDTRFKGGVEYKLLEKISLRAGAATNPVSLSFGVGYALPGGVTVDVSSAFHQYLGATPGISIVYSKPASL